MSVLGLETIDCGKDITRVVDMAKLGFTMELNDTAAYLAVYAVKVVLSRVHAEFTKKDFPDSYLEDSTAAVDDKIAALYSGDIRRIGGTNPKKVIRAMTIEQIMAMMTDSQKAELTAAAKKKSA